MLRRIGRALVRAGLAANPAGYAVACRDPAMADPTYCAMSYTPRQSRRERRAEREARAIEAEQREYDCGDWRSV